MDHSPETHNYTIQGMTCAHCVLSVREEVSEVDDDIDDPAVRAAVAAAGYEAAS